MGKRGDGCGLCGWTGNGRGRHKEQQDGVTEEPWRWWKIGSTDTNNVRSDKNLKNYRSNLNRVISVLLMLILADCFKTGKLSFTHQ